jgi:hypothetical protein
LSHFAIVTRDELWSLDRRAVLESRLIHGSADDRGGAIDARDDCDEKLRAVCDQEAERVRATVRGLAEGRARFVVSARTDEPALATISVTVLDLSIVTTLEHLRSDYEMLVEMASVRPQTSMDYRGVPVVWRNGSGAVLLHEAAGHPAEHGRPPLQWPQWLSAMDRHSDLLAGDAPDKLRRQSFSDVPLRRMTDVVVNGSTNTELPPTRIDILLVAGGRYEPLTEAVSLSVSSADFIDRGSSARLRPFVIRESRPDVARAMRGSTGAVRRYPGVICSKEGQELFVGSHAPDLITEF